MAQLTGQQINNSYQGLLKTESNAAIGAGNILLTDGAGNSSKLTINTGIGSLQVEGPMNPVSLVKQTSWTKASYPMGVSAGQGAGLSIFDQNGASTASIIQDRYGSVYYENTHGNNSESHVFVSKTGAGGNAPAVIRMDAYNAINNSTNWFTGYNQSVTDLQVVGQDLTLSRQGTPDLTVTLPGGGGGSAGLVSGAGADSMASAASLTTTAAVASTDNSIAIGDGANIAANPAKPTWTALGHIAIGENAQIIENSFGDYYSRSCIAIGKNTAVDPSYDGGNIAIGDGADSTNMHGIAIGANTTAHQFAVAMGQNANASAESTFALGRNANASILNAIAIGASTNATNTNSIAIGQGATAEGATSISIGDGNTNQNGANLSIGRGNTNLASGSTIIGQGNNMGLNNQGCQLFGSNLNIPAGINDFVGIGRINNPTGTMSNTVVIGLVAQVTDSSNSVAIGRGSSVLNANNSVAIGRDASATTGQSVAIGYQVTATKANTVTVNELALATVAGGITMISPNGTEFKLTVSDAGALIIT